MTNYIVIWKEWTGRTNCTSYTDLLDAQIHFNKVAKYYPSAWLYDAKLLEDNKGTDVSSTISST
jgi:hypothetical protein